MYIVFYSCSKLLEVASSSIGCVQAWRGNPTCSTEDPYHFFSLFALIYTLYVDLTGNGSWLCTNVTRLRIYYVVLIDLTYFHR
jgi:hypothetical protein